MVPPDRHNPEVSVEYPPQYSEEVVRTWELFEELRGERYDKAQSRSGEITETIFDFGGLKRLVSGVYEAAPLVELMEELKLSDAGASEDALKALRLYKSKDPLHIDYVRAVSGDMLEINSFIDEQWKGKIGATSPEKPAIGPSNRQYKNPWNIEHEQIALKDVLNLMSDEKEGAGVNIESLLISAASAYNTLRNSNDISEDQLLKTVYAVNSFYRPVLEIIGYDAFAMALEREAILVHMSRNQGRYVTRKKKPRKKDEIVEVNYDKLEAADDLIQAIGDPIEVLNTMMPHLLLNESKSKSVLHDTSGHGIQFGSGYVIGPDDNEVPLVWRLKSDVGIAAKYNEETKKHGADILGVTVIIPSYEYLAEMFAMGLTSVENSRELLQPDPSRHKEHHLVVKGKDVQEAVTDKLTDMGYDPESVLHIEDDGNPAHQVAKITILYRPEGSDVEIPVEIQFQTSEDRAIARAGEAAHALKRKGYKVSESDLMIIKRIHERRMMTSEPGLTDRSMLRQQEIFLGHHVPKKTRKSMGSIANNRTVRMR